MEFREKQLTANQHHYGFRYREISSKLSQEEQLALIQTVSHNAIFFQLEGELRIRMDEHEEITIHEGEMYCLPRGANVSACIVGDHIQYIVVRLDHNLHNYKTFERLCKIKEQRAVINCKFESLKINKQMNRFLESIKDLLIAGVDDEELFHMKFIEMQSIFKWFYTPLECVNMFYHIASFNSSFAQFVLNNYHTSTSIEELVAKANMSRSTFNRKFKEAFNTTPLKWIDKQTRQKIIQKAAEPNISVKDIMYEVGVYNASQFTQLCRRLCGVVPSKLIRH